jgi:hypothetical protein
MYFRNCSTSFLKAQFQMLVKLLIHPFGEIGPIKINLLVKLLCAGLISWKMLKNPLRMAPFWKYFIFCFEFL